MEWIARHKGSLISAFIATAIAAATPGLEHFSPLSERLIYLLIPGVLLSMAVSGNVHAFSIGVAAIGNFLFWLLLCLVVKVLIARIRRRPAPRNKPDSSRMAG